MVLDGVRRISALNDAACRVTGYSRPDLVGRPCAEVLDARDGAGRRVWADRWPATAALASVKSLTEQTVSLRRRDGSRRHGRGDRLVPARPGRRHHRGGAVPAS